MADRRKNVARGNFIGGGSKIVSVLFGVAVATAATGVAAQGAGPYYEDDSVVVDLSVLDDGGRGKRPAHLPPAGVVPGSSHGGQVMPGTEPPRSRFHGPGGQAAAPQASQTKPAPAKRVAAAKSTPAPVKIAEAPQPVAKSEVKKEPPPKPAPIARVTSAEPPPASATTPPPPPPVSTPAPLPPAPVAAPAAPEPAATAARPPAAPEIAPPAPSTPPPPAMPTPPPVAAVVAPPAPAAPTPAPAAPSQPLSIAPPAAPAPVATAPVPPPAAAKPPEAPAQASLPPVMPAGDRVMQISFAAGESRLPGDVQGKLKDLAEQMKAKEALRMQLVAYAAGGDLSSSAARRLSLSRALAVRTFLIDNGVRSTRIDVRALGDKAPDEPANRVDVSLSER